MKALRWFQTKVGLFQDPRIMYLLSQPHGDSYFVIWFYLKDLAGMINDDGCIYVSENQPVTAGLLARQLHRRRALVDKVLDVLEQIDLISRDETGLIRIVPWHEIQSFSRDEKKRSDARERMRRYRQRQKAEQSSALSGMQDKDLDSPSENRCEPMYANRQAAVSDRADWACAPFSESHEAVLHDTANSAGTQRSEAADEMSRTDGSCAQQAYADTAVRSDGDRDGRGNASDLSAADGNALMYYETLFGRADRPTANALKLFVRCWNDEAVCRAICIAWKKGVSSFRYIHAILVNSKGNPSYQTAPNFYGTEPYRRSGRGGLCHVSEVNWSGAEPELGEGIRLVYE